MSLLLVPDTQIKGLKNLARGLYHPRYCAIVFQWQPFVVYFILFAFGTAAVFLAESGAQSLLELVMREAPLLMSYSLSALLAFVSQPDGLAFFVSYRREEAVQSSASLFSSSRHHF